MKDKELNAHVGEGIYMKRTGYDKKQQLPPNGLENLEFSTATPYESVFGFQSSTPLPNWLKGLNWKLYQLYSLVREKYSSFG